MTRLKTVALSFALTFCAYLPSVRYDFVEYDDVDYVLRNEHMRDGLTVSNAVWAATSVGYAYNWHPLAWTSLMADVSLLRAVRGEGPGNGWGYRDREDGRPKWSAWMTRLSHVMHFHNVLLHSLNAALLCLLLILVLEGRMPDLWALGFALLWALHPLRVEVVCWVAERKELLSVFFMLLSLVLYVKAGVGSRSRTEEFSNSIPHLHLFPTPICYYVFSLSAFALSLLSKPVAVTLPVVLFAWDWIFRRRVRILGILPFVLLSALTCVLTMLAQTEAQESGERLGWVSRVTSVLVAPLVYVRQTVWPTGLSLLYERTTQLNVPAVIGGVLLVVAILAVGIAWLVRRYRTRHASPVPRPSILDILAFGVAWVYVGLLPMLGIVKVGHQEHSDRYTYWVGCGVSVALLLLLAEVRPWIRSLVGRCGAGDAEKDWRELRTFSLYALGGALAVLAFMANGRMRCWRDTTALFRDAITKCWEGEIAENLVLKLRYVSPEAEREGEWYLRECMTRHPNCGNANCLAEYLLLGKSGEGSDLAKFGIRSFSEAEGLIEDVLRADPGNKKALELKGRLKERRGEDDQDVQR